jgi:perosamine synthetase
MNLRIPYSRAWITKSDLAAVRNVLASGQISQGSITKRFENEFCLAVGGENGGGVGVGSGIAALIVALWALDIGPGDEVIIPSYICREVTEAVIASGAKPIYCDVGLQWVVTVDDVKSRISPYTRAVIVPHLFGIYADMTSFISLDIPIIEDCSQAFNLMPDWQITGDIATFSFRWSKCMTTGEGGMAVSKNPKLASRMRCFRDGFDARPHRRLGAPLSDLSSALGLSQLKRYPDFIERRRQFAVLYKHYLDKIDKSLLADVPFEQNMFYRIPIKVPGGWKAHHMTFLEKGIAVNPGVLELQHLHLVRSNVGFCVSAELINQTIVLPIYPAISRKEQRYCLETVSHVLETIFSGN